MFHVFLHVKKNCIAKIRNINIHNGNFTIERLIYILNIFFSNEKSYKSLTIEVIKFRTEQKLRPGVQPYRFLQTQFSCITCFIKFKFLVSLINSPPHSLTLNSERPPSNIPPLEPPKVPTFSRKNSDSRNDNVLCYCTDCRKN